MEATLDSVAAILLKQPDGQIRKSRQQTSLPNSNAFEQNTPGSYQSEAITSPAASIGAATQRATIPRMPNLFTFNGPEPWKYDCREEFFADQLDGMTNLRNLAAIPAMDLSRPHLWRLQQSFVENVLKWLPLFDHETALRHLQSAQVSKYVVKSASLCLVFLMYAIGSLASDTNLYARSFSKIPGISYYVQAFEIMKDFPPLSRDLCILQCRTLEA